MEKSLLIGNPEPIEWWLEQSKISVEDQQKILNGIRFIQHLNGDLNDFDDSKRSDDGTVEEYNHLISEIVSFMKSPKINPNEWDLLLRKRATIHINEIFDYYADENTLVVVSNYQHITVEDRMYKCKNLVFFDTEEDDSTFTYNINNVIKKAKNYKRVLFYFIGTEYVTGRWHSNSIYTYAIDKMRQSGKEVISVMDACQEMFMYERDYSAYDFVIGTVHAVVTGFDTGLVFINKNTIAPGTINQIFNGYRRCDVLRMCNDLINIVMAKLPLIHEYSSVMEQAINKSTFGHFCKHNHRPNFNSIFLKENSALYDDECIRIIRYWFLMSHDIYKIDPWINVEPSNHKPYKELFIRERAQSYIFRPDELDYRIKRFSNVYGTFLKAYPSFANTHQQESHNSNILKIYFNKYAKIFLNDQLAASGKIINVRIFDTSDQYTILITFDNKMFFNISHDLIHVELYDYIADQITSNLTADYKNLGILNYINANYNYPLYISPADVFDDMHISMIGESILEKSGELAYNISCRSGMGFGHPEIRLITTMQSAIKIKHIIKAYINNDCAVVVKPRGNGDQIDLLIRFDGIDITNVWGSDKLKRVADKMTI